MALAAAASRVEELEGEGARLRARSAELETQRTELRERVDACGALLLGGHEESGELLMHWFERRADGTSRSREIAAIDGAFFIDLAVQG